jgi:hypothetical protein
MNNMGKHIRLTTGPDPMSDYQYAWEKCRSLTNQFVFALIVQLLIIAASIYFTVAIRNNSVPVVALQVGWLAIFVAAAIRLHNLRCPRCGEKFFVSPGYYHNVFARRCLNCGLPKYSN